MLLYGTVPLFAQNTIKGRVTDSNGGPLLGVSVKIKGSTTGVSTNADGTFILDAPNDATLAFSNVGFITKNQKIVAGSLVVVSLEQDSKNLNKVVVTAMGIRRTRNSLPYAAQQVQGDEVSKTRSSNFVSALSGKVFGLEIRKNNSLGGSTNVVIRGAKSLTGNNRHCL